MRLFFIPVIVSLVFSAQLLAADKSTTVDKPTEPHPTKEGIEFFEKKIRPILVTKCYACHSAAKGDPKAGLVLDTREGLRKGGESGAAVVPRDPDGSLLVEALRHEGLEMPPKEKLSDEVIANFVKWIEMGAPDPRGNVVKKGLNLAEARLFWAYQPPKQQTPPSTKDKRWARTDIDRFVLAALEAKGLKPVGDADRSTLLRRVTLDLTGLPPTPEELQAFVDDSSPDALSKVVDRLLASPQFGERWGRHWLDVARYGESTGKERNVPYSQAWRYRDWVIDAINADKPYDRFVVEQIAGDLLPATKPEVKDSNIIATGFLAMGPKSLNERNREQYLLDIVDEQIDVVSRAVIATTVACARCHDHKFDPIPTTDYYALAGIFRSTEVLSGVNSRNQANNRNYTGSLMPLTATSATPAAPVKKSEPVSSAATKTLEQRVKQLQAEIKQLESATGKKNRGKLDDLAKQLKKLQRALADSQSTDKETNAASVHGAMGVRDLAQVADMQVHIRGEVAELGPKVPRGFVTVLKNPRSAAPNAQHSGRLELANWLSDRGNPLTARVAVNRAWAHLFGAGLVESLDNFGALGEPPSHPELLDQLAVTFMDQQHWSLKQLIRSIVLSRTYQLSSAHHEANYAVDPGNRLVWRMNRRRLDAESIRDSILMASGQLDLKRPTGSMLGKLDASTEIGRGTRIDTVAAERSPYRSVYLPLVRNAVPEMLGVFDMADPSLPVAQREVTTVATQALFLMNNSFVVQSIEQMAQRLLSNSSTSEADRIDLAYRIALSRQVTADERTQAQQFLQDYRQLADAKGISGPNRDHAAWTGLCHVLLSTGEFRYVY